MLELKNIKKSYTMGEQTLDVLKGVDLKVSEGDFLAIMGPSGSGKSTLMNIIGMLDDSDSGEYYINNERVDNVSEARKGQIRRENIGFIFQNYSLIPRINVLEQVKLPLIYQGISNKKATDLAMKALEKVGLKGKEKNMPNEISGGQKQRVSVARALVISPTMMLADEPTGALDTKTSEEIMDLFEQLNKEGKTIIVITHEPEVAERTKKTIIVRDGNIINS
ncbi:MAG: ABC transporter ATP-binding protein [Candidatus Gracilibacteria bacterium]|nr:ABC transporter ATP-binding protein [Candidatus Gracilibacteria bacterium]